MFAIHEELPYFQRIRRVIATPPTTPVPLCTVNPDRAILLIGVSIGSQYWVSSDPAADPTQSEIGGTGPDTVILDWQHHGPLPTEAWYGQIGGASGTVRFVVVEYIWTPPPDEP